MTMGHEALALLVLYGHVYTLVFNYITELLLSTISENYILDNCIFQNTVQCSITIPPSPTLNNVGSLASNILRTFLTKQH
jgi:hypothetical protein